MKFAFHIVSVLPFVALVSCQNDAFIGSPNADACGADRCVPITHKPFTGVSGSPYLDDSTEHKFVEGGATDDEVNMDYDLFFDFMDYDTLCHVCITLLPEGTLNEADDGIEEQFLLDNGNCLDQSAELTDNDVVYEYGTGDELVIAGILEYRLMTAAFWQDTDPSLEYDDEEDEYPERYYHANYCINNFRDYIDPCCVESETPSRSPSKAPSSAPSVSPTTSAPKDDPCFSSMSTVYVQEKGQTSMANVEVGDVVLTMNGFEKIYTIDHRNENEATDFVQIVTETDNAIELTSKHLIYLHDKHDPVEAGTVKVGDKLLSGASDASEVFKVSIVTRNGLFNPITSSGTLVVDGIATSTYTAIDVTGGSSYITIGGYKIISIHDFLHLAMGPFKMLCMNVPEAISSSFCLIKEGEEHNVYNKIGLRLLSFGKNQNINVQSAIVMSLVSLFVGFSLLFNPIVMMISLLYTAKTLQTTKNL